MTRSHPDIPTGAGEAKPAGRPSGVAAMLRGGDPGDDEVSAVAHTQRMATIGTLLSSVTHEMNNPLTFVLGNVRAIEELLGGLPPSPEREELTMMAAEARLGCERLVTIVGDLRLLYRSNDEPEPVHVSEVVEQSLRTVRAKIRRRTQCERRVDELPPVLASPTRLSQVLMNLVLNAAEAMPQSRSARDNLVSVDARFEDGEVVIAVSDNGVGIAPGDMPSLFEPFYSKKPLKEGSGLGLYVCRNLVEAMGGRILVESEVDVGTTFMVRLPPAPAAQERRSVESPSSKASHRLRVLLVDDEQMIVAAVARQLRQRADVVGAGSVDEAWGKLADGTFDAIISDVLMDGGTGIELYERVREERPELASRFMLATGLSDAGVELPEGVTCLHKPFDVEELWERLCTLVIGAPAPSQ